MSLELDLQLRQQLKLNPQLQQSLKLLQLNQQELAQEIQLQINNNPLLSCETPLDDWQQMDDEPQQVTAEVSASSSSTSLAENSLEIISDHGDLKERLEFQLQMHSLSRIDLEIGYYVIENLNRQGFLTVHPQDICQQVARDTNHTVEADEVLAIIHLIQTLEPVGCGSQDLQEFLLLQIRSLKHSQVLKDELRILLAEHFHLLSSNQFSGIQQRMNISGQRLKQLVSIIQDLKQRPNDYQQDAEQNYIIPDVRFYQQRNRWQADVSQKRLPKMELNTTYMTLLEQSKKSSDKKFLQDKLQQAQSFLQSLEARGATLQRVADFLVKHQAAYLNNGDEALKPLKLNDVADALELHESTISRATSNKYCQTPQGVIKLKQLFSNAIKTQTGGEWSQTAIKNKIQQIIKSEPSRKPLSDNSIVRLLAQQGISIARRTVAKYRDALQIPSASKRKQLSSLQQFNPTQ